MFGSEEIKTLSRQLKDFDMYDAANSTEAAWKYLVSLIEDGNPALKQFVSKNRTVANAIKSNAKRRSVVARQAATEVSDEYKELYLKEIALLDTYCYAALGDLLEEMYPEAWEQMMVAEEEKMAERAAEKAEKEAADALKIAKKQRDRAKDIAANRAKKAAEAAKAAEEAAKKFEELGGDAAYEAEQAAKKKDSK